MNKINVNNVLNNIKREKNAIILAHYYTNGDVQDIADYVGDSLELSRKAADTDADIILFAGVKFMAETAKIISPEKTVLMPDINAGCSLADACEKNDFRKFIDQYDDKIVISYINSSTEIKAMSDVICTSANAIDIVKYFGDHENIIFGPDKNLGAFVKSKINRELIIWDGACHVHEMFNKAVLKEQKSHYPDAKIICHPECNKAVQDYSDFIGSTSKMLKYIEDSEFKSFIIVTDPGIIHQMEKRFTNKQFIPAEPTTNVCEYMKMITVEKIIDALTQEKHKIEIDNTLIELAKSPIEKMLKISQRIKK